MKTKSGDPIGVIEDTTKQRQMGLTKREYFAALALQGLSSYQTSSRDPQLAVKRADALIKELNKENKDD